MSREERPLVRLAHHLAPYVFAQSAGGLLQIHQLEDASKPEARISTFGRLQIMRAFSETAPKGLPKWQPGHNSTELS